MSSAVFQKMYFLLFIGLICGACEALVDDKFENYTLTPVVNSILLGDSIVKVHISLTSNLDESTPTVVENATVILRRELEKPDTLKYTTNGWYISNKITIPGETYYLEAKIPGFKNINSSTTIPNPTAIDSIKMNTNAGIGLDGARNYSVEIKIRNDITQSRFWQLKLKSKGISVSYDNIKNEFIHKLDEWDNYIFMKPDNDSVLIYEAEPLTVFCNKKMKLNSHWIKFYFNENIVQNNENNTLFIEVNSIDSSYYRYIKKYHIYKLSEDITIGQSPQKYPLYSNINNGLGLFSSCTKSTKLLPINSNTE